MAVPAQEVLKVGRYFQRGEGSVHVCALVCVGEVWCGVWECDRGVGQIGGAFQKQLRRLSRDGLHKSNSKRHGCHLLQIWCRK